MFKRTAGIHHITAIVGNPQENHDFYANVLGLRLVKRTVNFDDPGTYHLYFGNDEGSPGTIMTFFPWPNGRRGQIGAGQVGITTFVVPENALAFWEKRLLSFNIKAVKTTRFGETFLQFDDPHGVQLEIVERGGGPNSKWELSGIDADHAIKGFGGAVLFSQFPEQTGELLEQALGLTRIGRESDYCRYRATGDLGNVIDVALVPRKRGRMGVGTVHHIAWRAQDDNDHQEWREHIQANGFFPTGIIDRQYFHSIYFREPGEILFEIATDPPGFTVNESSETLGKELLLPSWLEPEREKIESTLPPIIFKGEKQ